MPAAVRIEVEVLPVGASVCLFHPDTQATCLLNATAARILEDLAAGRDDATIAAAHADESGIEGTAALRDVAALREGLARAGLIGVQDPGSGQGARETGSLDPARTASGAWHGTYALGTGPTVGVGIDDSHLAALVSAVLAPLQCVAAEPATGILATCSGRRFTIACDGATLAEGADLATARRVVLQSALLALHPGSSVAAILHASALTLGGNGVLLAGATGSGKTTLLLALLAAGGRHVADDFTPLGPDGATIAGFPVAVSVKSGSWELAARDFPHIRAAPQFALGARSVRYLDVSARREARTHGIPARILLFPRYAPGAATACTRLAPEDALQRLMASGSAPVGARPSMRAIVELVSRGEAWSLEYSDTAEAVAAARRIAEAT